MTIYKHFISAEPVQFLQPFEQYNWPDKGMVAHLTDVQWREDSNSYQLWFDFSAYEAWNDKYFKESYQGNATTCYNGLHKAAYTAKEAGKYSPKYTTYFSIDSTVQNDAVFEAMIAQYLRTVSDTFALTGST